MLALLLTGAIGSAKAQDPVRPWLNWRTIATPNYRLHFPAELEPWAAEVASHVESVDSAIVSIVGYAPARPIHVVIDDPFMIPNGYALPFVDRPGSVWWATPPDPRNDVGNYTTWGEMLAVHELTHIAHLARPSRNPFQRQLWSSLPANIGPIARKAPRWVFEGYATMVEGRITGTGRPNNAWRPAILRQWAIEGRLPTYGQLSGWDDYEGGAFAYLSGSAYLEWLARREGDSSLVHVWRRLSARIPRSFDVAFAGVYGDGPATLYGRHAAELTRDAMAAKAALERAGIVEGQLVQHLAWETGDPALSPDGERVAVTIRDRDRPSRVEVWTTRPDPEDTASLRRRIDAQKRDPQDVPDRRFYPPRKKALKTLVAWNGRSFGTPRWLPDGQSLLVTRWSPRPDGTLRPDLWIWDSERDTLHRVTKGAGILNADPNPRARDALAMRCRAGHCDVARVDLGTGLLTTILEGDPRRSYYRPRYSPDGRRFVASVSDSGRWHVVVANSDGSDVRHIEPADGANRYDATWLRNDTLVVVSERGGIANVELLDIATAGVRALTRVTGAAAAPDVHRRDGSIWYLSMHSRGFDVRRFGSAQRAADSVVSVTAADYGFAGVRTAVPAVLGTRAIPPSRAYGVGPRHQRWIPGGSYSADGASGFITIYSGDIVGRFDATATGALGEIGTVQGGSLRATWRFPRPTIEFGGIGTIHEPSRGRYPQARADSIDGSLAQGFVAIAAERLSESWRVRGRLGGAAGVFDPRFGTGPSHFRGLAFGDVAVQLVQSRGTRGLVERLRFHSSQGQLRAAYRRSLASIEIETTGRDVFPLELRTTVGQIDGTPHPFERFTIGGAASNVSDSSIVAQRYAMPMFPTAIAMGNRLLGWRVALPTSTWTLFFEGASAAVDAYNFRAWNRVIGVDLQYMLAPVPVAFAPRIYSRGGAGYTLDDPFRHKVRFFLEMRVEP